jgi:hypothetical protein
LPSGPSGVNPDFSVYCGKALPQCVIAPARGFERWLWAEERVEVRGGLATEFRLVNAVQFG